MTTDLHMHTTASDGDYPPLDLMQLAAKQGITTLAITDHDTTAGIQPARVAANGLEVIAGIELSAETEFDGDVHMLGYFIDIDDPVFQAQLMEFQENRYHRGRGIVRKLNSMGVHVDFADVEKIAGGAPITRPHIARALVNAGHVDTLQAAFDRYIADDAPAYVSRVRMPPEAAIDLIHSVGGVAVLAHPALIDAYERVLTRLIPYGLDGVEINHPKNPPAVQAYLSRVASEANLIVTGGSDFHRPELDGSITLGQYPAPPNAVAQLRAKASTH